MAVSKTRSTTLRAQRGSYDLGDGILRSVAELGERFGLKPNTITTRLKRGWTVKQAVGLTAKKNRHVTLAGKKYPYTGKLTYSEILTMRKLFEVENLSTIEIGKILNIDASQVWRLCDQFEFKRPDATALEGVASYLENRSSILSIHPRWNP